MTIEEVSEISNQVENIDGDDVYILDKGMKEGLNRLKQKIYLEKEKYLSSILNNDVEFVCNHSDFAIAFRPVRWMKSKKWIPCLIYKHNDVWRRVVLQYANCLKCSWSGTVANPTNPDLYITMENRFDILNNMNQLSFCKCPKCGSEISSKAIWIEDMDKG